MAAGSSERMRADWNERAREDAHYYVAFGRRGQDDEEFFATAGEVATGLRTELRRLPRGQNPRARRALEIGCGPGRLMRPLSDCFGEIHGVDVSDAMIELAREKLKEIPHAHPHHAPGSDLKAFADDSFDFVYSYAVFQHIPDEEVVYRYFRETRRVLKEGGIARFQINGLPLAAQQYDTWSGVRIAAMDVARFTRENDFQLLALEGRSTQYMWTTWRKRRAGWIAGLERERPATTATLRRITNAFSSEPIAPNRGRFASISLWIDELPDECDLNHLTIKIGGEQAFATYIGPPEFDGLRQVNAYVPDDLNTGLQPVEVLWLDVPLCSPATLRIVPPGPPVPRVASVSDGINLLSGKRIVTRSVKVVLEEAERPDQFEATLDGHPITNPELFCADPRLPLYEINFPVPEQVQPGERILQMRLGQRRFAPVNLTIA